MMAICRGYIQWEKAAAYLVENLNEIDSVTRPERFFLPQFRFNNAVSRAHFLAICLILSQPVPPARRGLSRITSMNPKMMGA